MKDNFSLGISLFAKEKFKESFDIFYKISLLKPNDINNLIYLALSLMKLNDYQKALSYLVKINKINSKIPQLHFNFGICHYALDNINDAKASFGYAIELDPKYSQAYTYLGEILVKEKKIEQAVSLYQKAEKFLDSLETIYINLSKIYIDKRDYKSAIYYINKTLDKNNQSYTALINLAKIQIEQLYLDEAILTLEKAIKINDVNPMAYFNLGLVFKYKLQYSTAIEYFKKCIALNTNLTDPHFSIGEIQLSQNDFKNGWENYEFRWFKTGKRPLGMSFDKPLWKPKLGFGSILIWGEQGLGDQILFSTIIEDAAKKFAKIYLAVDNRISFLFDNLEPNVILINPSNELSSYNIDYHLPIGSLCKYFRGSIDTFSKSSINPVSLKRIKKTGINYKCAISVKSFNRDTGSIRSIKLNLLEKILKIENIDFYDIQYDNSGDSISNIYKTLLKPVQNIDTFKDIKGIADFIKSCDFIICASNTNSHIAGFLKVPTYLLAPMGKGDFWYWHNNNHNRNLWYPSIQVFHQSKILDWSTPINNLEQTIKKDICVS